MSTDTSLIGGNLVSFSQGIAADLKAEIMDCLLFAQLSADAKYQRGAQWKPWIEKYQKVIFNNGSPLSGAIDPLHLTIKRMRDVRNLRLSGTATSPQLQALVQRSFDQLMDSDHANAFFSKWFTSGRSESFQVVPCQSDGRGGATVMVCGLQMTTREWGSGLYFWQILNGEMTVRANGASFRFTRAGYEPFRQAIQDALADHALRQIIDL